MDGIWHFIDMLLICGWHVVDFWITRGFYLDDIWMSCVNRIRCHELVTECVQKLQECIRPMDAVLHSKELDLGTRDFMAFMTFMTFSADMRKYVRVMQTISHKSECYAQKGRSSENSILILIIIFQVKINVAIYI